MNKDKIVFETEWPTQTICPHCFSYNTDHLPIETKTIILCKHCNSNYFTTPMRGGENYTLSCEKEVL